MDISRARWLNSNLAQRDRLVSEAAFGKPKPPDVTIPVGDTSNVDWDEVERVRKRVQAHAQIEAELAKQAEAEARTKAANLSKWRADTALAGLLGA